MGLRISVLINVFFTIFLLWYFGIHVGFDVYYQKYFAPRETFLNDIYYKAKVAAYTDLNRRLKNDKKYIVFAGDSLIEQWPVYEFFAGFNVLNRGIGFDTTNGVLKRLADNLNNINISKLFIMVGHNDLKYRSVNMTIANIKRILNKVKAEKKYFISILPSAAQNNNEIQQVNRGVMRFCHANKIEFINSYPLYIEDDGAINALLYYDGVHLNIRGYSQLSAFVKSYINDSN